jgi:hypothetical protein
MTSGQHILGKVQRKYVSLGVIIQNNRGTWILLFSIPGRSLFIKLGILDNAFFELAL